MTQQASQFEIHLKPSGAQKGTKVLLNGQDVTGNCKSIKIESDAVGVTKVTLEYIAAEVKVLGSGYVTHKTLFLEYPKEE